MRSAFVSALERHAEQNKNIMLLTGDLGFRVLEKFRDSHPKQFLNCGIAEQNMVGVASGLALCGHVVFVYSIIPFVTFRVLEQIRDDVCYHDLAVCIVGVGAGYAYGYMGSTHHALEDVGVLRCLAGMTVIVPGDPWEVERAVEAIVARKRPTYLRLGKDTESRVHNDSNVFTVGKMICVRKGMAKFTIVTMGVLELGLQIAKRLDATLLSCHTIKPLDDEAIKMAAEASKLIVTIEGLFVVWFGLVFWFGFWFGKIVFF